MTDKLAAVAPGVLGYKIGELTQEETESVDAALRQILRL
jgi:hypothetical protein